MFCITLVPIYFLRILPCCFCDIDYWYCAMLRDGGLESDRRLYLGRAEWMVNRIGVIGFVSALVNLGIADLPFEEAYEEFL